MNKNIAQIRTEPTDNTESLSKKQVVNYLLHFKRLARRTRRQINELRGRKESSLDEATLLDYSAFNSHRITELANQAKYYEQLEKDARNDIHPLYENIVDLIRLYDQFKNNSNHEKAQLLSINHKTYEKFLKSDHSGDGSLLFSASMHAECHGENEDFIGESGNRDHPFFDATNYVMMKALSSSKEMQQAAQEAFTEVFGEIPMYRRTVDKNGSEVFERVPPKLSIVGD